MRNVSYVKQAHNNNLNSTTLVENKVRKRSKKNICIEIISDEDWKYVRNKKERRRKKEGDEEMNEYMIERRKKINEEVNEILGNEESKNIEEVIESSKISISGLNEEKCECLNENNELNEIKNDHYKINNDKCLLDIMINETMKDEEKKQILFLNEIFPQMNNILIPIKINGIISIAIICKKFYIHEKEQNNIIIILSSSNNVETTKRMKKKETYSFKLNLLMEEMKELLQKQYIFLYNNVKINFNNNKNLNPNINYKNLVNLLMNNEFYSRKNIQEMIDEYDQSN